MNWFSTSIRFVRSFEPNQEWFLKNRGTLVRVGGIILVLLVAAYVSPRIIIGNHLLPRLFFFGLLGLCSVIVAIKNPSLIPVAIIPISMLVPFSIGTGTGTPISAVVILDLAAIAFWVMDLVINHKTVRTYSLPAIPAIALMGSALISLAFGQLTWFYTNHAPIFSQIGGTMLYIMTAGIFLVMAHQLTRRGLAWMVFLFLLIGASYVAARFLGSRGMTFLDPFIRRFSEGAFGSLFWVWLVSLSIGMILFYKKLSLFIKAGLVVLVGITIYLVFIYARDWTSGWLPAFVAVGVMLWAGLPKWRVAVFMVTVLILAFGWKTVYDVFQSTVFTSDNAYSEMTRLAAWKILWNIFIVNPVLGVGPANYYFYTPLYPIMGYSVSFNSHNNYIDLLLQTGLVGFACFTWFFIQITRMGFKLTHLVKDDFEKAFVIAATGGVVGTAASGLFGDWVIPFVYNVGFDGFRASIFAWLFMGGLMAIERHLAEEPRTDIRAAIQQEAD